MLQVSDKRNINNATGVFRAVHLLRSTLRGVAIACFITFALSPLVSLAFAQSAEQPAPAFDESVGRSENAQDSAAASDTGKESSEVSDETPSGSDPVEGVDALEGSVQNARGDSAGLQAHLPHASADYVSSKMPDHQLSDEPPSADETLYVSREGNDGNAGTQGNPLKTISAAAAKANPSGTTTVVIMTDLSIDTTAEIGSKTIVITGDMASVPLLTPSDSFESDFFHVADGSLTFRRLVVDGKSKPVFHHVVYLEGKGSGLLRKGGSLLLGEDTTVQNWFTSGTEGAFFVTSIQGSMTMNAGSIIKNCQITRSAASAVPCGGAAINIMTTRSSASGVAPDSSWRAYLTMKSGSIIKACACNTSTYSFQSGGGAIHASEVDIVIESGAQISDCSFTFANAQMDSSTNYQGGGAIYAYNSRLDMDGSISNCMVRTLNNKGKGVSLTGGGAIYLYDSGCNKIYKTDCRAHITGIIKGCSALAGGAVFYFSINDGYEKGTGLWTGSSGPLQSAAEVMEQDYDYLELSGFISGCYTYDDDSPRTITFTSYGDFEQVGIGGGAISGAYNGLIVLDGSAKIDECHTGSEGGAVSNYGTALFCLADANNPQGPQITKCKAAGIAGGLSFGGGGHIENVKIDNCVAGIEGGGMYFYSGSETIYNCSVTNCSAVKYGGGMMIDQAMDLFMYGATIENNHADGGGGGMALNGSSGPDPQNPRGLVFNYPSTANGGYTNAALYRAAILTDKITAPTIVSNNTQGDNDTKSNIWTLPPPTETRIFDCGLFIAGSNIGVCINNADPRQNAVGEQFGWRSFSTEDISPFVDDVQDTLYPGFTGARMIWKGGFTITYEANPPEGSQITGSIPFDGIDNTPHVYPQILNDEPGSATVLGEGDMAVAGYRFLGWSADPQARTPTYVGGSLLTYSSDLDTGEGHIKLFAVWAPRDYVCQIIRADEVGNDHFYKKYETLYQALNESLTGDRIEMIKDAPLAKFDDPDGEFPGDGCVKEIKEKVMLTTAPRNQSVSGASPWEGEDRGSVPVAIIMRTPPIDQTVAWMQISGSLTTTNITFDGGCSVTQAKSEQNTIRAQHAFFEVAGRGALLNFDTNSTVQSAYNATGKGGAVAATDGAHITLKANTKITDSSAAKGGGALAVYSDTQFASSLEGEGVTLEYNYSFDFGGAVLLGEGSTAQLQAHTSVTDNESETSGGGIYLMKNAALAITNSRINNNKATAQTSAVAEKEMVGGVGTDEYADNTPTVTLAGEVDISGNLGRRAGQTSQDDAVTSDLEAECINKLCSVQLAADLADTAKVGIISPQEEVLLPGAQFAAMTNGEASSMKQLDKFFNDTNAVLFGTSDEGEAIRWQPASVNFTKVGANQTTGLYEGLAGVTFNVYRYRGASDINAITISDGTIDLAGLNSSQWAPLVDDSGAEGTPADTSNRPYSFSSLEGSDGAKGSTTLKGLKMDVWYMLVETGTAQAYSKPSGQWAFQIEKAQADGSYTLNLDTMLAHKGSDGSLPPAFARQVTTASGQQTGTFLINIPLFDLPFAGMGQTVLWELAAVGLVMAAVGLRMRSKGKGELR